MKLEPICSVLTAIAVLIVITGCKSRNAVPEMMPEEVPPAQYGMPGSEIPMPPGQTGGRFGYTGANSAPANGTQAPPAPRDVRNIEGQPSRGAAPPEAPKKEKPASPAYKTASRVPGDPLSVTLSGVGKVSIEKYDSAGNPTGQPMASGTAVKFPDPNNPGQKIYFKVP